MNRFIEIVSEYPFTCLWLSVIIISIISMISESIKKRKNRD
jgi:hypothetical protein